MKTIFFTAFMFLTLNVFGQLSHFGSLEYVDEIYKIIGENQLFSVKCKIPELSMSYGIRYDYKRFYVSLNAEVMMDIENIIKYTPKLSIYTFESGFKVSKSITVKYSHSCVHPVITDGVTHIIIYGGFNKLGIFLKTSSQ